MEPQEAHDRILKDQRDRAKATGLSDWKPRTSAKIKAFKEKAKREEAKYFHNLNGNKR